MKVSLISPEQVLFDGDAEHVVAPAFDGFLGILAGHAPMVTLLGQGELRIEAARGGGARSFRIEGGFLQVADNHVRVVTERAASA
jgi:F-type H+-transporting ATPase subunit epsilon